METLVNPDAEFVTKGEADPSSCRVIFTLTDGFGEKSQIEYTSPEELSFFLALVDDALTDLVIAHEEGIEAAILRKGEQLDGIINAESLDIENLEQYLDLEYVDPDELD